MKIIKLIPFYLFLALNAFIVFVYFMTYPSEIVSDQMPWNAEGLGWMYENKINYTIMTLIDLIIVIAPSVYAWRNRKISMRKAYLAVAIPFFVYLGRFIYYKYFFNI